MLGRLIDFSLPSERLSQDCDARQQIWFRAQSFTKIFDCLIDSSLSDQNSTEIIMALGKLGVEFYGFPKIQ